MSSFLFHGGWFLDPREPELAAGIEILVEGDRVKEVSDRPIRAGGADRIDIGNRTIMPGLIDGHLHIFLPEVNIGYLEAMPLTLLAVHGAVALRDTLRRGFTSVRDTGGGDFGIKAAVDQGLLDAPRLFIAGQPISQTGGHGDFRKRTQTRFECGCCSGLAHGARIADGVPEVLKAVRDELRKGADLIKIMVSGGVASQSDPLESLQFRMDEIEAAVEEATNWGTYVAAHAYSARAVLRAVNGGVRTIEHGNLIDEPAAALMAKKGAYLVPTLVAYDAMKRRGRDYGLTEYSLAKNDVVLEAGLKSIELARAAGVKIGFGSDLLGQLQDDQCREFLIRSEIMTPFEIIQSASVINAEILMRSGELGELVPGAYADLLVVDGNPYRDLNLFQDQGRHLAAIMKGGKFYKNNIA